MVPSEVRPGRDDVVPASKRLTVALIAGTISFALLSVAAWRSLRFVAPGVGLLWLLFLVSLAILTLRVPSRRLSVRRVMVFGLLSVMSIVIVLSGAFFTYVTSTDVPLQGGNGYHFFEPSSLTTTKHDYRTVFGETRVDLSQVRFPVAGYVVNASAAVGEVVVVVPANAIVSLKTNVGIGSEDYSSWRRSPYPSATGPGQSSASHTATASLTGAPHLILNVQVGVGHVEITRATPRR